MDSVTVDVIGADDVEQKLARLPVIAAKAIVKMALARAGKRWADAMRKLVRRGFHVFKSGQTKYKGVRIQGRSREFGVLSRSIGTKVIVAADGLGGEVRVGPRKKAYWGLWLEFGSRKQAASPFIRPAYEQEKQGVIDDFVDTCKEELDKAGLKVT